MLAKDIKTGHILNYHDAPCMVESITVQSPSARGAATFYKYRARNLITKQKVDITLRGGDSLAEELKESAEPEQRAVLQRLRRYQGRFDVLHFEQIPELAEEDEEPDELLDPGALLAVLGALASITGGVAVDPQSGTILNCEE